MQVRLSVINTSTGIRGIVASPRQDINLPVSGPRPVFLLARQHGDPRPEPVARGELCHDFDLAVFDIHAVLGDQPGALDRVDHGQPGRVGHCDALRDVVRGARPIGRQVQSVSVGDCVDAEMVRRERGDNVQDSIVNKRVVVRRRRPLEAACPVAVQPDFAGPRVGIEGVEVVIELETRLAEIRD